MKNKIPFGLKCIDIIILILIAIILISCNTQRIAQEEQSKIIKQTSMDVTDIKQMLQDADKCKE